ncbi:hypothetical protein EBU99_02005 [bacterium]|nr:hypothetical protein [bacterium]
MFAGDSSMKRSSPRSSSSCGVLCLGSLALGLTNSACSSQIGSNYTSTNNPQPVLGAKVLAPEMPACPDDFRPLRVAIIVDNTGSNGASPGNVEKGPNYSGTDVLKSFSDDKNLLDDEIKALNTATGYTDRQLAVFKAVAKLQKSGLAARAKNANFAGIDVGIAHFPYAPANLSQSQAYDENLMYKAVYHNGPETGLPNAMTDVSKISESTTFNQKLWSTLDFTHYSRGMTPYKTAFEAAYELLSSEKNKKQGETRAGLMILVTDGLPTDRKPSEIAAARASLGKDTRVVLMSVYAANPNDENQNSAAKTSLQKLFNSSDFNWGKEEFAAFTDYWNALLKVPQSDSVRDDYIQVKSTDLKQSLDNVIDRYVSCTSGSKSSSNSSPKGKSGAEK